MAIRQIKKIKVKTMPHDQAYFQAEKKTQQALKSGATELDLHEMGLTEFPESLQQFINLQSLNLTNNNLVFIPDWLGNLLNLESLSLSSNQLRAVPETIGQLSKLQALALHTNQLERLPSSLENLKSLNFLNISDNRLSALPAWIGNLTQLDELWAGLNYYTTLPDTLRKLTRLKVLGIYDSQLTIIPDWISELVNLETIYAQGNFLTDLPSSIAKLNHLKNLNIDDNPLNSELAAAYKQDFISVKTYLHAKTEEIIFNEAKLILVGEGEVGKSCLLNAMRDEPWDENLPTTHGVVIKKVYVSDRDIQKEITLNAWDFGGQRVYRPTHQLFFSAPAVYLVVWKPREGSQAGQVKEWIQLVKRREPSAKILVVATHGGPNQRQPDIDRQELWDLFGHDTVVDFFFVESKPDEHGNRKGIDDLKRAIAQVAASLPEVGRSVPKSFADVRAALQATGAPYLPFDEVLAICRLHNMDDEIARLFITISHPSVTSRITKTTLPCATSSSCAPTGSPPP